MGKPVPGWDVDVFAAGGERAPDDVVGNIGVRLDDGRPVGLFDGYVGDAEANATAFRDGNYYSGDKAWRDGDGYLWFEGRDDDVFTSAAYRIGPFEVESALVEHDAVVEAAVVGRADPDRTQIVTAFVVLSAGREGVATSPPASTARGSISWVRGACAFPSLHAFHARPSRPRPQPARGRVVLPAVRFHHHPA